MTRKLTNAFAIVFALLLTTTLMTPAITVPADEAILTTEIA
jgi:hypothetical protein